MKNSRIMEFQTRFSRQVQSGPTNPEKEIPAKPDKNPDPTKPKPGGNEPKKNDPTRITEPPKTDPTRITPSPGKSKSHKWVKVNGWDELMTKIGDE